MLVQRPSRKTCMIVLLFTSNLKTRGHVWSMRIGVERSLTNNIDFFLSCVVVAFGLSWPALPSLCHAVYAKGEIRMSIGLDRSRQGERFCVVEVRHRT
eukprot:scaffold155_cov347-Pavlova_lutheri.AAC.60